MSHFENLFLDTSLVSLPCQLIFPFVCLATRGLSTVSHPCAWMLLTLFIWIQSKLPLSTHCHFKLTSQQACVQRASFRGRQMLSCWDTQIFGRRLPQCSQYLPNTPLLTGYWSPVRKWLYNGCQRRSCPFICSGSWSQPADKEHPQVPAAALWVTGYLGACIGFSFLFTQLHLICLCHSEVCLCVCLCV